MSGVVARLLRGWRQIGARLGTFLALVALCGILGAGIALPLWLFATSHREAYTITVAAAAGVGLVVLAVQRAVRRLPGRAAAPTAQGAVRGLASALLAAVKAVLLVGSLGATVALAIGERYLAALPAAAVFLGTAVWIGIGAGRAR